MIRFDSKLLSVQRVRRIRPRGGGATTRKTEHYREGDFVNGIFMKKMSISINKLLENKVDQMKNGLNRQSATGGNAEWL